MAGASRWSLNRCRTVAHEVVDVVEQGFRPSEVGVAEEVDVEVGHRYRVDAGNHGVGLEIAGARRVVQFGGEMYREVGTRGVEGRALGVFGVEAGEVEEEVTVDVRCGGCRSNNPCW